MSDAEVRDETRSEKGARVPLVVVGLGVLVVAVIAYATLAMPGMDHSPTASMGSMVVAVGVEDFAARLRAPSAFVINVHVPDEGTIEGTDARIPYDRIAGHDQLPTDKGQPILLYCKTGRMSATAATALMESGYTDVVHLDGGMDAWRDSGRPLR